MKEELILIGMIDIESELYQTPKLASLVLKEVSTCTQLLPQVVNSTKSAKAT